MTYPPLTRNSESSKSLAALVVQRYESHAEHQADTQNNFALSPQVSAPKAVKLRAYQQDIADQVARATRHHNCPLVVLPTGAGKTVLATSLAARMVAKGSRVWFVVHRIELLGQAVKHFKRRGLRVGVIAAGQKADPTADVTVIMVQTLVNRAAHIPADQYPHYIFVDECHHATADQYGKAFAPFPKAKIIGLTATPERADGTGLGGVFDVLLQSVDAGDLIAGGYLVRPLYYTAPADLAGLHSRGGDYQAAEVFERVNKRHLYNEVVQKYLLHGRAGQAIVYNVTVAHSKLVTEAFNEGGVAARHLDAETPADERKQILADFAAGRFKVLCNVSLFTEGFDLSDISVVILNRPTQSRTLYVQMVGRGGRPTAGFNATTDADRLAAIAASSKPRFVVIDLGGNLLTHGFWEAPITYSLDAPKRAKRAKSGALDIAPIKTCPKCGLMASSQAATCEACSYTYPTILDRLRSADFVATEYGGALAVAALKQPKQKEDKSLKWPEHLRWAYGRPAKLTDVQLDLVQKHAGYVKGWSAGVRKRRGAYQQAGGVRS